MGTFHDAILTYPQKAYNCIRNRNEFRLDIHNCNCYSYSIDVIKMITV